MLQDVFPCAFEDGWTSCCWRRPGQFCQGTDASLEDHTVVGKVILWTAAVNDSMWFVSTLFKTSPTYLSLAPRYRLKYDNARRTVLPPFSRFTSLQSAFRLATEDRLLDILFKSISPVFLDNLFTASLPHLLHRRAFSCFIRAIKPCGYVVTWCWRPSWGGASAGRGVLVCGRIQERECAR